MSDLGELLSLEYGEALPAHVRTNSGFPVYGSNGIVGHHERALVDGPGAIVGRKGSVGKVSWSQQNFWPIDTTYYVRSKGDELPWLYRVLDWLPLDALDTSTGVPGLNRNDVYRIKVFRPPAPEQQRIAHILDTLDTQIRQTEALIAKLERVKQGLLTDLLTLGIDENGQLRPPPDQAPHLYKDSPLGRIPREWTATTLALLLREPVRNGLYKSRAYHGGGPPMVQMSGLFRGENVSLEGASFVRVTATEFDTYRLRVRDLLFARRSLVFEGAGKAAIVGDALGEATFESSIIRARVDPNTAEPEFIALFFGSARASQDRRRYIRQVAVSGVSAADIRSFVVILPPLQEQGAIVQRYRAIGSRIRREFAQLGKLTRQKNGLMDDLLTGRVRVTRLLQAAKQANG